MPLNILGQSFLVESVQTQGMLQIEAKLTFALLHFMGPHQD